MRLVHTANIQGLQKEMRLALIVAEEEWTRYGQQSGVTITCGLDGCHSAGSLHYYGYAIDCRTRYWSKEVATEVFRSVQARLKAVDRRYGVVLESTHMHIQYKPEWAD